MRNIIALLLVAWIFLPATRPKRTVPRAVPHPVETFTNRGYRQSRSTINVGGYVFDQTLIYETWRQSK